MLQPQISETITQLSLSLSLRRVLWTHPPTHISSSVLKNKGTLFESKTGALCCVAARPHGANLSTARRGSSMDPGEPFWRTNSSFSPPLPSRSWDSRLQPDGLPRGSHGAPLYDSSLSTNNRESRSRVSSDLYTNHQHSVSDGVLSYFESPPENFQALQWTPPVQKLNFGVSSTSRVGGSRTELPLFPHSAERRFAAEASAASNSLGSPSSLSESSQLGSTSKRPMSLPYRHFSSRRPFISKPVYPLVFRNPVSDSEGFCSADTSSVSKLTPSQWRDSSTSLKFHKNLTELHKMDASPEHSTSSRREGFRFSNASSFDVGFDEDGMDISEHVNLENIRLHQHSAGDQNCELCGRLLWQKSPWSSYRIVRGGDMPIAGVLYCSHVFHAECLEQTTPKSQIHDPPCPVCLKTIDAVEESPSVSEPLQMALRSVWRNRGVVISDARGGKNGIQSLDHVEGDLRRNQAQQVSCQSGSLIKNHLKKRFMFKGGAVKDFFSTKGFHRTGSSSSNQDSVGRFRSFRSLRK
ncbi:hypothetical protein NE237_009180 [Protea cynaroides]|uniref:RING-type domain-containing protein n=1 Tax=Protea cynaroides TaxID=273540 RepID=A0A9Q0R018_9MAGN|nr:hypothetical protein NE237_009180 [Protea cynaroides]